MLLNRLCRGRSSSQAFFNNLYWWCTNQSFVQRALAAKSLKEGQMAIYCGFLKTIGFLSGAAGRYRFHLQSRWDKNFPAAASSSAIDFAYPALVSAIVFPNRS